MAPTVFEGVRGQGGTRGAGRAVVGAVAGVAAAALLTAPASADGEGEAGADAALVGLALSGAPEPPPAGEEFVYRATIANDGKGEVEGGLLAQHVPEPLEVVEVGQGGVLEEGVANWRVDVPAGGESEFTVRVRLPEGMSEEARVVSTACLLLERDDEPSACASDTLLVAEPTALSKVGAAIDREAVVRAVGVGALMLMVWLLWRQWRRWGTPRHG
ncbi:MAG TPA: hypothetical protein K8V84_01360 [Nocardiopsis listeri]|uniref:hypothetical protein n=1 Tax=Nocardiopsis listeri TaxID=53440 RepID=UPI001D59873D|nr:hypothetical protein [Nocardiopsis listeri]HJE57152.1 hypothetical protein [Nocardiopsis listeri]